MPLPGEASALALRFPALLDSGDLQRVTAVTRTTWSTAHGRLRSSSLVLTLRTEVLERFHAALQAAHEHQARLALVLHGEVIGVLTPSQPLTGNDVCIDGTALLSLGNETDHANQTRNRARQINATLR